MKRGDSVIYFLLSGDEIIYVGISSNFAARIAAHLSRKDFDRALYVRMAPHDAIEAEKFFISEFQPRLNATHKFRPPFSRAIRSHKSIEPYVYRPPQPPDIPWEELLAAVELEPQQSNNLNG